MSSLIFKISKLICLVVLLTGQNLFSQEKIKADLKIINFLGRTPYKTEGNTITDNLLRILYFRPQPENNPKIGFLDTKGEVKIMPIYNMASDFYNGYANIIRDSIYGYIDKKGIEFLFKQYQETYFYYGNTGIAKKDDKFGLIDRIGNQLTDFKYNMIYFFGFNHFTGVLSKDSNQLLDNSGRIIFNKNLEYYIKSNYFEKDSLLVYEKNIGNKKLQGLVGLDNKVVTDPIYDDIYFIEDKEFFLIKKNKKFGFINKKGKEIIPFKYKQLWLVSDGLIRFVQ